MVNIEVEWAMVDSLRQYLYFHTILFPPSKRTVNIFEFDADYLKMDMRICCLCNSTTSRVVKNLQASRLIQLYCYIGS